MTTTATHYQTNTRAKLLRWAGSKTQSKKHITELLDFDKTYIEPFCGSASFFFSQTPKKALLNDTNKSLIGFYKTLRSNPRHLWEIYSKIPTSESAYYETRAEYNQIGASIKKSAYFLYLNHYCFNGIYRTNRKGAFNTPVGTHMPGKQKLSLDEVLFYSRIAKRASFYNLDFGEFLREIRPSRTTIFMDPPYFTNETRVFDEYGEKIFQQSDLDRLMDVAISLSKRNRIIITYKDCAEFRDLFDNYISDVVEVTRNVGGFSGRRKRDRELVAILGCP